MEKELSPKGLDWLVLAAKAIRDKKSRQKDRLIELQQLAKLAKQTGKSQSHRITESPEVFDYGDVIEELCEALEYYEKHKN